jgi:ankyrin repeat domain-containing protein 17
MASFRKGHNKVVKYLVRQVRQFPSDADCRRLISTITDKVNIKIEFFSFNECFTFFFF